MDQSHVPILYETRDCCANDGVVNANANNRHVKMVVLLLLIGFQLQVCDARLTQLFDLQRS